MSPNPTGSTCRDCGAPMSSRFCPACGMKDASHRLTFLGVFREVVRQVLDLESPLLRTFVELVYRPGGVASDYVAGRRRSLSNPIKYCIIAGIALLVIDALTDTVAGGEVDMGAMLAGNGQIGEALERSKPFMEFYSQYFAIFTILSLPALAWIMRLFFNETNRSSMDWYIFSMYIYAQVIYYQLILQVAMLIHLWFGYVALVMPYIVYSAAAVGFVRQPAWRTILLSAIGHVVVYSIVMAMIGAIGGILFQMLGGEMFDPLIPPTEGGL